ncbi:S8 family peptidase [Nocardioides fonticola]|uniref:S8 family peptidase n=1 Tax=Nocardioides fonticola TaxID=450363 RepID=A0ABP7Y222_9ACTN
MRSLATASLALAALAGAGALTLPGAATASTPDASTQAIAAPTAAAPAAPATAHRGERAPLYRASEPLAQRYIVVLDRDAAAAQEARAAVAGPGGKVTRVYATLDGYAAKLTPEQLAAVRSDPDVAFVQQDGAVHISTTQSNATWGLDRIDQRNLPLSSTYSYTATGSGVRAYVIDTGIYAANTQFGSRVAAGATAINDGRGTTDCNGHGTHVAGTIGGSTYGVAKAVTLVPVRVLDCSGSGSNSGVIAGMDWVASNAVKPAVANMSLGGAADAATDAAVARMTSAGVTVVVAAGNDNTDACSSSPARAASAITVAASTNTDARASFSNYGSCVDIFAPGQNITSAWIGSTTATNTISGTSMASPHVAGVAALYLQGNPSASPATVASALTSGATSGVITGANGSPNRLLYTAY